MDPSFKNGLVEINPSTDGQNNVWYDAYILDVQPLSTPCSEINAQITGNNDGDDDSRTPNPLKPFTDITVASNPFARSELPVPFFLQQGDSTWLCNADFHERFGKNVENLINIHYDDGNKLLICLGYTPDRTEYAKKKFDNQCHLLSDFHFRALKETHSLCKHLLPPIKNQNPNESILHIAVAKHLIGLSIGKQGANIHKARELDGIQSIELYDPMNTFIIKGSNMEA
ncbi:RNA binding protein-like protein, partial [Euroglyphus maynei]